MLEAIGFWRQYEDYSAAWEAHRNDEITLEEMEQLDWDLPSPREMADLDYATYNHSWSYLTCNDDWDIQIRTAKAAGRRSKVVDYLIRNPIVKSTGAPERCAICSVESEGSLRSDGKWVWPQSLAHYVSIHHVTLPPSFVDDMAWDNYYVQFREDVDEVIKPGSISEDKFDYSMWKRWKKVLENREERMGRSRSSS